MISLIICSRTKTIDQKLAINIESTIGVPYEVVLIDNSDNQHSICAAYNLGVQKSIFPNLCFMHDDILYHTNNWGKTVLNHFQKDGLNAFGIAGTPYYSFMPGAWWGNDAFYEHILQSGAPQDEPALKSNFDGYTKLEVVAFDGVWFCIKKMLFDKVKFDETTFKGFHFYDTDICMQLHQLGIKLYCIADVLVQHISMGSMNEAWIENALIFHHKWELQLPANCIKVNYNQLCRFEYKTLNGFIWICSGNNWPNKKIYSIVLKYLLRFKKGYLFYKTPGYLIKFTYKMLFKKGAPFYSS